MKFDEIEFFFFGVFWWSVWKLGFSENPNFGNFVKGKRRNRERRRP